MQVRHLSLPDVDQLLLEPVPELRRHADRRRQERRAEGAPGTDEGNERVGR